MRELEVETIIPAVRDAVITANYELDADMLAAFKKGEREEGSPAGREIFRQLLENARIASEERLPLCQDCGLAVIFAEVGQDLRLVGGDFEAALQEGVRQGYQEGYLRKSLCHPLTRQNTGDNTPAVIHTDIVPGDRLKLLVATKGGGSENGSKLFMLKPAEGLPGIREKVLATVAEAGPNVCPPVIVGLGLGGNFERAAVLAKRALLRKLADSHPDPEVAALEQELLTAVNDLGIGPGGLGGRITALGVKINLQPCHIASLPLAINIQCHSSRHREVLL